MTLFTDLRQTKEYADFMQKINWQVEKFDGCQILIKKIPILGLILKIQRPDSLPLENINQFIKKNRVFMVSIEPKDEEQITELEKSGFKKRGNPYICSKTIQIDLTKSEDQILAEMKKDNRYEINKVAKEGALQLIKSDNLSAFRDHWKKSASWQRWVPPIIYLESLKNSFGENLIFLIAEKDKKINAGICLIFTKDMSYYYYAFSNSEGKKLGAPYFLVWQGILESKKRGCKIFDFEGIYDERFKVTKSWIGFTHFKKGFGGKEVVYPEIFMKLHG